VAARAQFLTAAVIAAGSASCTTPAERSIPSEITDSVGMHLRLVPGGSFVMGSDNGQPDERPPHPVSLEAFYIGVYEVTQQQYESVIGWNPATFRGPTLPVETLTWYDAREFCRLVAEREGVTYRLPREAEWEYAARGGLAAAEYSWGDLPLPMVGDRLPANVADESFAAEFPEVSRREGFVRGYDDLYPRTAPVGSFAANGYGLFDLTGNVFEWCEDVYVMGSNYGSGVPTGEAGGDFQGGDRVMRGASWWAAAPRHYRVASRFRNGADHASAAVGFRCLREAPPSHATGR